VGRTPAQVLLRWCLQRDLLVIPKSTRQERIRENAGIFDFTLSPQDLAELDALDRTDGTDDSHRFYWHRFAPLGCRAMISNRSKEVLISINLQGSVSPKCGA